MAGKVDWYRRSLSGMPLTTVDSEGNQSTLTAMAMIKRLCDGLNHEEFFDDAYRPSYTDRFVKGIHLWHNLCILEKGLNNEGSIVIPPKTLEHQEGG